MQDYKTKLQTYLRVMVRDILRDVTKYGLHGDQHYYIAFSTKHPNVIIPKALKEKHPSNLTIVLQNDFENLQVFNQSFSVQLTFDGDKQQISVPLNALTYITDPSENFALEFNPDMEEIKTIDDCQLHDNLIYFPSRNPH